MRDRGRTDDHRPDFEGAVLAVLGKIPAGVVISYGEVAAEAGFPGAARAVGNLLRTTTAEVPWWRVAAASGLLIAGHSHEQARRLRDEGVVIRGGRVSR